jgi:uncharacterized protein (TIGR02611 family)
VTEALKTGARNIADRMRGVRARVRERPGGRVAWRVGVTLVGLAIIALGVVLLPLPGPGWVIIFAGLGLLATEYEWAARLLRTARRLVREWTDWARRQSLVVRALLGLAGLAIVAGALALVWWISLR